MLGSAARRNISRESKPSGGAGLWKLEERSSSREREIERQTETERETECVCVCERERGKKRKRESERESFVSARAIRSNVLHLTNDSNVITVLESA